MAVYNITKINPNLARAIAIYYGVSKVQLRYSDFLNEFGAYVKNKEERDSVSEYKRAIVQKHLHAQLGHHSVNELKQYPEIVILRKRGK